MPKKTILLECELEEEQIHAGDPQSVGDQDQYMLTVPSICNEESIHIQTDDRNVWIGFTLKDAVVGDLPTFWIHGYDIVCAKQIVYEIGNYSTAIKLMVQWETSFDQDEFRITAIGIYF